MKVELFAIVKNKATAPVLPQQMIHEAFSEIGSSTEDFKTFENPRAYFGEMAKAFSRAKVIVATADKESFLEQKWTLLKALGLNSEICSAVVSQVRNNSKTNDPSLKAHALMPKDATVFMTSDGLYSGFAVKSGKQTLCYIPLDENITPEIINKGIRQYFKDETNIAVDAAVKAVAPHKRELPDNDERFVSTATTLAEKDLSVAIASTQTSLFVQNGIRNHPHYGDSFIFTESDDVNESDCSSEERLVRLAESSRSEIGTELGAVISNIYAADSNPDEMFIYVALSDKDHALVRKIVSLPGETANDLVHAATDTLYSIILSYADGTLVPGTDSEMLPVKLYEDTNMTDNAISKQKKGVALKIAICVAIALILSLLIGFYFKDEVAALFVSNDETTQQVDVSAENEEFTFFDVTEESTTEPETVDFSILFETEPVAALSNDDDTVQDIVVTTTKKAITETTKAETTTVKETTTKAETTTETTTRETTTKETTTKETTTKETTTVKETTTKETTAKETTTESTTNNVDKAEESTTKKSDNSATFTFTAYGYGHGVGMSQLGAVAYGDSNGSYKWKYDKILSHYFTGTTLKKEIPPLTIKRGSSVYNTREFLIRTVQGEIGGSCKVTTVEAIKAQVVAAYTYLKYYNYSIRSDMMALASSSSNQYIAEAVDAVYGEYLCYTSSGSTAFTPFYASSAGKTSSAQDTWGGSDYPTLSGGIESPEKAGPFVFTLTSDEFKKVVNHYNATASKKITLSGSPDEWIEILEHDGARGDTGYIKSIRVGDKTMRGNSFRAMIMAAVEDKVISGNLKSHCFSLTVS